MRNVLTRFACVCTVALLMNFGQTRAGVVVSNLTDPQTGEGTIYAPPAPQEYAQEFYTGSQSGELADIIVPLGAATGSFTASAELLKDTGSNSPLTASLVTSSFTVPSIGAGISPYPQLTFTPNTSVILTANTNYWFVLTASGSGGSYKWGYPDTTNATSLPNYAVSDNSGASWTVTPAVTSGTAPFLIEVDSVTPVSAVPEPSSVVLIALGVPAVAVAMRRRCASTVRTKS
jgi:hypothetical protein